jgi:hypothetical protein
MAAFPLVFATHWQPSLLEVILNLGQEPPLPFMITENLIASCRKVLLASSQVKHTPSVTSLAVMAFPQALPMTLLTFALQSIEVN